MMNNITAYNALKDCIDEFSKIKEIEEKDGIKNPYLRYIPQYALIKACGTIEFCFKTIIADFHNDATSQIQNYITKYLRDNSRNPTYNNICNTLKDFDSDWEINFKQNLNSRRDYYRLVSSLNSLNNLRNTFAHGRSVNSSLNDIVNLFDDACEIIYVLDHVVN